MDIFVSGKSMLLKRLLETLLQKLCNSSLFIDSQLVNQAI